MYEFILVILSTYVSTFIWSFWIIYLIFIFYIHVPTWNVSYLLKWIATQYDQEYCAQEMRNNDILMIRFFFKYPSNIGIRIRLFFTSKLYLWSFNYLFSTYNDIWVCFEIIGSVLVLSNQATNKQINKQIKKQIFWIFCYSSYFEHTKLI